MRESILTICRTSRLNDSKFAPLKMAPKFDQPKTTQTTLKFLPLTGSKKRQQESVVRAEEPLAKVSRIGSSSDSKIQASSPQTEESSPKGFVVNEEKGDLFTAAPENAVLIHACNCQGAWGGGIAAAFRDRYPNAYKRHQEHCQPHVKAKTTKSLVGTAQFISPQDKKSHFIGCVFTSNRYGRNKDSPDQILHATESAMEDLISQINEWNKGHKQDDRVKALYMCKINSGLFNVDWNDTRRLLENMQVELHETDPEIMVRDRT
jgi:ADP-ribose 1''-phosphate phosphatase